MVPAMNRRSQTSPESPMQQALALARRAASMGEVPVGAVLVDGKTGKVMAKAANATEARGDPTAHAEMLAIRKACAKLGVPRLESLDLYVTLEPCPMCATAISFARLRRVYFGAYDPKGGGVEHGPRVFAQATCHHRPEVFGGIEEKAAGEILKAFFKKRR
jgi:tRNA(Arg) A34 adenosine deaminase TadA